MLTVDDTIWEGLMKDPAFQRRKAADQVSYTWDALIEGLADLKAKPIIGSGPALTDLELVLRTLALEPRLNRRVLGPAVREFLELAKAKKLRSRVLVGSEGRIYVFVYFPATAKPQSRTAELGTRCVIARHKIGRGDVAVGIGLSEHVPGSGSASDLVYLHLTGWSVADDERAAKLQVTLGDYKDSTIRNLHVDEYPTA